jgi:hypothetical protein
MTRVDFDAIQEMAARLGRPPATLRALAEDPHYLRPANRRDAEWFAALYRAHGFGAGVHLRRIHYRLISQKTPVEMPDGGAYGNTEGCWNLLMKASKYARYADLIDINDFTDRHNPDPVIGLPEKIDAEPNVAANESELEIEIPDSVPPALTLSAPVPTQPYHLEIWIEKSTADDILIPLAQRYGLNVQTGVGETSLTRCLDLVKRADDRPIRILYVSDFDPGGLSMPVAAAVKIGWLNDESLDIQLQPVALTHDQCIAYRLPRTPIKETENRAARFEERFGESATELDALEALHPGELERILVREIERFHDPDFAAAWAETKAEAYEDLEEIASRVLSTHAQTTFATRLEALRDQADRLIEDVRAHNEALAQEMLAEAPDLDDYEWPEPRDADEWADPLFDSKRDYVEQVDRFKAHQGKPTKSRLAPKPYTCAACGATFMAIRVARWCSARCRPSQRERAKLTRRKKSEKFSIGKR